MRDTLVSTEVIRDAVQLACRAPSLHNSQPWRWVYHGDTVDLFLDQDRVLYGTDPTGRESLLSCGAVLDHFRVAMCAAGWTVIIERFPNPNNRHHLASVGFRAVEFVTEGDRLLAEAISRRRTDRLPFAAPPDWDLVEPQLHSAVNFDTVRLDTIADELRPELARASELTASLRLYDSSYHAEMAWWTHRSETADGIPQSSLVSASESERVDIARDFPVADNAERRAEVGSDHSKIMVLSTFDSEPRSMLHCGEMLSALLLEATRLGLATCTLTHITELPKSRAVITSLTGRSTMTPQVLVRVGLAGDATQPPPTPRRPVDDVLEIRLGED